MPKERKECRMLKLAFSQFRPVKSVALLALLLTFSCASFTQPAGAEKYQSRLNSLILKKNDLYLPARLVIGEEAHFVVKAPAGSQVKILLSPQNSGYKLPNGTELRVGTQVEALTGVVPENGVLQLNLTLPKDPGQDGKTVYVEALYGTSDEDLAPIEQVDASGRRTADNALAVVKPSDAGSMSVMPNMPGVSPQLMNQLNTLTNSQGTNKQLLDNGSINSDRAVDRNPFAYRGYQPGIQMGH